MKELKPHSTVVLYHKADFDGIFCREIAKKFLPPDTVLIGWDYGDPTPEAARAADTLYMLDISVAELMGHAGLIWIDHHKSAIEKWEGPGDFAANLQITPRIAGYRIDGVAACRLAWQWFTHLEEVGGITWFPTKEHYVARAVDEPLAVRLAGEYDIWDKRDPRAELFQHGLRSMELKSAQWDMLLGGVSQEITDNLLNAGVCIQYAKTQENKDIITSYGFTVQFEGLTFLACNHARFNSFLFTAALKPEHDACLGFKYDGQKRKWLVSLYHAPGKEHIDLSPIAVKYGGGGHKGACGFSLDTLPFIG